MDNLSGTLVGTTALLETDGLEVTCTVAEQTDVGLSLDADQEPWPPGEVHQVHLSIFATEALLTASGRATADGAAVQVRLDGPLERIQRRRWPRRRMDLPVTLCPEVDGARVEGIPGRSVDVGVGGICVETLRRVEGEGDPMIIVSLPDGTSIVTGTSTVEVEDLGDGWRYRLAFRDLDGNDAGKLAQLTAA